MFMARKCDGRPGADLPLPDELVKDAAGLSHGCSGRGPAAPGGAGSWRRPELDADEGVAESGTALAEATQSGSGGTGGAAPDGNGNGRSGADAGVSGKSVVPAEERLPDEPPADVVGLVGRSDRPPLALEGSARIMLRHSATEAGVVSADERAEELPDAALALGIFFHSSASETRRSAVTRRRSRSTTGTSA